MFYPLYQYPYLYLCIIGLFLHIIKEFSKPCSTQPNLHILCWLSLSLSLIHPQTGEYSSKVWFWILGSIFCLENWKVSSQLRHIKCFFISPQKKKKNQNHVLSYDIKAMEGLGFWLSTIHGFIELIIYFHIFGTL